MKSLKLETLKDIFSICRLSPDEEIPSWALAKNSFFSITKTEEELSIVCKKSAVPTGLKYETDWRCLKVMGPLDFSLTGILLIIAEPLAKAQISIFSISTFDTDYVLVRETQFLNACEALSRAGHQIIK